MDSLRLLRRALLAREVLVPGVIPLGASREGFGDGVHRLVASRDGAPQSVVEHEGRAEGECATWTVLDLDLCEDIYDPQHELEQHRQQVAEQERHWPRGRLNLEDFHVHVDALGEADGIGDRRVVGDKDGQTRYVFRVGFQAIFSAEMCPCDVSCVSR